MFPIEWTKIRRAKNLKHGELAYLQDLDMSLVIVGTINEITVAVMLGADVSKCTTRNVEDLSGAAFSIDAIRFEGDVKSLERLEIMDDRYEALVVSGSSLLLVARPPSNAGYVTIEIAELEEQNPSSIAFAYRAWRIVKDDNERVVELYRKGR